MDGMDPGRDVAAVRRPRCGWCDRLLRPWTTRLYAPRLPDKRVPVADWEPATNQRIVSRRYVNLLRKPDGRLVFAPEPAERHPGYYTAADLEGEPVRRLDSVSVWDGAHYVTAAWPFCSNPCAGHFASYAYRRGIRLTDIPTR